MPPLNNEVMAGGIGCNFVSRDLLEASGIDDALDVSFLINEEYFGVINHGKQNFPQCTSLNKQKFPTPDYLYNYKLSKKIFHNPAFSLALNMPKLPLVSFIFLRETMFEDSLGFFLNCR